VKKMAASSFKARCLAVIKKIQATGEPIIVTKRGTPVVKVVPAQSEKNDIFGFMMGKVKIVGDIESPIPVKWTFGSPRNPQNCLSLLAPLSEEPAELAE
jgi:prevent-host-death family protein